MTITTSTSTSSSTPLFVVVGATGNQGRSVIEAIKRDSKEYRVRGLTRDSSKPAARELAELGVEVVQGDGSDAESIDKAFQGANIIFAVTFTSYTPEGPEKELKQGRTYADAAKKAGAHTFIWSGLTSQTKLSDGKHPVWSYDIKAQITEYARSLGGMKVIDVQPGSFTMNHWSHQGPRKTGDGSYILPLPYEADSKVPMIDIPADFGRYAIGALNKGVETVYASSEYITPVKMAEIYSKVTGHNIPYVRLPDERLHGLLFATAGQVFADTMIAMFQCFNAVGYYGGADLSPSQEVLDSPARTFEKSLEANKEAVMKNLESQ